MKYLLVASLMAGCVSRPIKLPPGQSLTCPPETTLKLEASVAGENTWWVCRTHDGTPHGPSLLLEGDGGIRVAYAYNRGQHHGRQQHFGSGTLEMEGEWRDGQRVNSWTSFYESGQPQWRRRYEKGVEHGAYEEWFEDGGVAETSTFLEGKRSGARRVFHRNGILKTEEQYANDALDGVARHFHDHGRLASEATWHSGVLVGRQRTWASNGSLLSEGSFEAGRRSGLWLERDESGSEWRGTYLAGRKHGKWTKLLPSGERQTVVYENGDEGPLRPCPNGTQEVRGCAARCCDHHARWCETDAGQRAGPFDVWDSSGQLLQSNREASNGN